MPASASSSSAAPPELHQLFHPAEVKVDAVRLVAFGQAADAVAFEAEGEPVLEATGAEPLVEVQRRFVPIERHPLQPHVAALLGQLGEVLHDGAADAAAAVLGADVDVLEPDAGAALEGGKGGEED